VPIVPVAIIGTYAILPKGKLLMNPGKVQIRVGQPIETRNYTTRDKHQLAKLLQDEVAHLLHF
jgi:1-acyl-sn-glycerol-3-phosphate acyltransferase